MVRMAPPPEDDYEIEEKKQAAADVLSNYSLFSMVCLGEDVRPCDLRLHLMKEISGMRSTLKKRNPPSVSGASPSSISKASSSGTSKDDMTEA